MVGWKEDKSVEHRLTRPPRDGVGNVVDPALDAGAEFAEADPECTVLGEPGSKATVGRIAGAPRPAVRTGAIVESGIGPICNLYRHQPLPHAGELYRTNIKSFYRLDMLLLNLAGGNHANTQFPKLSFLHAGLRGHGSNQKVAKRGFGTINRDHPSAATKFHVLELFVRAPVRSFWLKSQAGKSFFDLLAGRRSELHAVIASSLTVSRNVSTSPSTWLRAFNPRMPK